MDEIEWADPPPADYGGRSTSVLNQFVSALSGHPGRWAVYPRQLKSASSLSPYRAKHPEVEWVWRKGTVYARWREDS